MLVLCFGKKTILIRASSADRLLGSWPTFDKSEKHWCVVRDRSFIVYPCQLKVKNIRPDTNGSPIHILPVEKLSVSLFKAPAKTIASGISAKSSLQIYCSSTETRLLFYVDQVGALEKWVLAIKAEAAMSNSVTKSTDRSAPIPFTANSETITPLAKKESKPTISSFSKEKPATTYFDDLESTKAEYQNHSTQTNNKQKGKKKLVKSKAVSSVTSENSVDVTPSITSSSSKQLMTSELASKSNLKESFFRASHAISPAHKRRKNTLVLRSSLAFDYQDGQDTSTAASGTQEKTTANLYGTISHSNFHKLLPSQFESGSRNSSKKRHTICEVPDCDVVPQEELHLDLKSKSTAAANATTTAAKSKFNRYSIAPLSSLDLRLRQKKKSPKNVFQPLTPKLEVSEQKVSNNLALSSDEEDTTTQSLQSPSADSALEDNRGNPTNDFRSHVTNVKARHQLDAGLNRSVPDLNSLTEGSLLQDHKEEKFLKPSGKIGSNVLRRVSSAKGKRSKEEKQKRASNSFNSEKVSFDSKESAKLPANMFNVSKESSKSEENSSFPATISPAVLMEGWLYRRKMMSWGKMWAVLTADQALKFYKSNRILNISDTLLTLNLEKGFSVEDITQDKGFSSFWLHPKSTSLDVDLSSSLKEDALSKGFVKPIQLMCKSSQEFMHWMKEFLLLNSASFRDRKKTQPYSKQISSPLEARQNRGSISETRSLDKFNHDWEFHPSKSSTSLTSFSSKVSVEAKIEEDTNKAQFLLRKDSSDSSSSNSSDSDNEISLPKVASPTVKVTFCDGNTADSEDKTPKLDKNMNQKSDLSIPCNESSLQKDVLLSQNQANTTNNNIFNVSLTQGTQKAIESEDRQIKVSLQQDTHSQNSLPLEKEGFVLAITSEKNEPTDSLLSKETGAKDNIAPCEKTGKDYQLTSQQVKPNTSEKQITNNANVTRKLFDKQHEQFVGNENRNPSCDCRFAAGSESDESCKNCDKKREFNDVIRREIENDQDSFSSVVAEKKTFTPFFSRPTAPPLHAINKTDGISDANERCSSSDAGRLSNELSQNLPTVHARIKLFESFASGIRNSNLEETENSDQVQKTTNSSLDTFNSDLNLDNCLQTAIDARKPRKYSSVEDLRAQSVKQQSFLGLPESDLRKATSESNLVDLNNGEAFKMFRRDRKSIPQLSQIDFIEIYGMPKSLSNSQDQFMGIENISTVKRRNSVESDENSLPAKDLSDEHSIASLLLDSKPNAMAPNDNERLESESGNSECSNKNEPRRNWRINSKIRLRKSPGRSGDSYKRIASKEQVLQIPASQLTTASHRSYLEKRNKKKQWEKFWCVFQDACLYFYNSPHSDATRDVIVLRGYEVIADVTNTNRERFEFRLQQEGSRTLYFSSNHFEEFVLWIGTLEKETRSIRSHNNGRKNSDFNILEKNDYSNEVFRPSSSGSSTSSVPSPMLTRSISHESSHERLEKEIVEMQKHKLLKELASQQQKLQEEQRVLDRYYNNESPQQSREQSPRNSANKRHNVLRKYDRVREQEEAKVTKSMAFLNRRRNSAQLKLDHIAKELAPKSGKKRRDDHKHFAVLEAKQAEMRRKLEKVDKEICDLQAMKQNALEKIQERQELALIVSEQQENIDILRKHSPKDPVSVRRRHKSNPARTRLSSIDELKRGSESGSSDSGSDENKLVRSKLTAFDKKRSGSTFVFDDLNKEVHPLTILRSLSTDGTLEDCSFQRSYSSDESLSRNPTSLSSSLYSLGSSTEFLQHSSTSNTSRRSKDEVDPSVIAGIEDFEKFSAKMLEKLKKDPTK